MTYVKFKKHLNKQQQNPSREQQIKKDQGSERRKQKWNE